MSSNDELNKDVDIDLGGIFASIWRNKFKLLIASLLMAALAFVLLQSISPRYRSEARILIRASEPVLSTPRTPINPNQSDLDDQGIASKIELLRSNTIARKIIAELALTAEPEFDTTLDRSPLGAILSVLGFSESASKEGASDRVLETYYDKLKVFQAERSRVIVIQFSSTNPKFAASIPNMIADEYMLLQDKLKRGAAPADLAKLEAEVTTLSSAVKAEENAMADFRRDKDLLQGSNNNSLATQELSELATELGRVRSQLSSAKANAESVRRALNTGTLDTVTSVLQSPLVQRLRERQVNLSTQLSDLSITLLPNHPRIQRTRSQMSTLNAQIAKEARKIESSLQQEANVAKAKENDLIQRRVELKKEAVRVDKEQVELQEMERELVAKRQLLSQYTVRLKEAKSRQAREFLQADAFIFSRAQVPSKSYFPKKLPILAGTFFGTFLLGSMLALIGSVLSGTSARYPHSIEANELAGRKDDGLSSAIMPALQANIETVDSPPLAPAIGSITTQTGNKGRNQIKPVISNIAITAKSLATMGHGRVVVMTPEPEGNSNGTIILARYLADQGSSVIVLDMTIKGLSTKIMLGKNTVAGVKDLLADKCSFGEAIHRDEVSTSHIMPTGDETVSIPVGSAEKLSTILSSLQQAYAFVIIDCGQVGTNGMKRVANSETMLIINAHDPRGGYVSDLLEKTAEAGYKLPLVIYTSEEEKRMMMEMAA